MAAIALAALAGRARAAECTLIAGAKVYLPGAKAADVDVVLADGRVREVGAGLAGAGCARVDGRGQVLTAGFVDAFSGLGLVEVALEETTVDTDLKNVHQDEQRAVRAAVRASLGYNPRSLAIPVARAGGVTSTLVAPSGGIISGGAFWADLAGGREAIRREPAAMLAYLGARSESRAVGLYVVDLALREAERWPKAKAAWEKAQHADFANKTLDLEALGGVVEGAVPLMAQVARASDIEALLEMTAGRKVRLVIVGGAEAWLLREQLAARRVPVIVNPLLFGPGSFDELRARPDSAALLHAAGVPVLMSVFNTHQTRKLRQVAGNAVREGLPWEAALLAVTEAPADAFGMPQHGRIQPGAIGNAVLWSGDPFEIATRVLKVFIAGREVPLESRQTRLFERWRTLP